MSARYALDLARDADQLYVAKGRKVVHVDLKREKPDAAALKSLLVGPTGNLRAPTLRIGRALVVGFDAEMYRKVFGLGRTSKIGREVEP